MGFTFQSEKQSNKFYPHTRQGCPNPALRESEWGKIVEAQAFRCFYCANPVTKENAERDHLIPDSQDGCACSGNRVASCLACNRIKKGRMLDEFLADRPAFRANLFRFSTSISLLANHNEPPRDFHKSKTPFALGLRRLAARKSFVAAESVHAKEVRTLRSEQFRSRPFGALGDRARFVGVAYTGDNTNRRPGVSVDRRPVGEER